MNFSNKPRRPVWLCALAMLSVGLLLGPGAAHATATSDSGRFRPLVLNRNDFNHCALGFGFATSQVTFGGVPFSVDPATDPGALTVGTSTVNCAASPVSNGEITVDGRGGTLWLIGAADNDAPFPNTLFGVTIKYTDGTKTQANVHEIHSGLPGFIEFSSWGVNGRPDLAVYSTPATDGSNVGSAYLYEFFVDLDANKTASTVTISAPTTINSAYIYAATLDRRGGNA